MGLAAGYKFRFSLTKSLPSGSCKKAYPGTCLRRGYCAGFDCCGCTGNGCTGGGGGVAACAGAAGATRDSREGVFRRTGPGWTERAASSGGRGSTTSVSLESGVAECAAGSITGCRWILFIRDSIGAARRRGDTSCGAFETGADAMLSRTAAATVLRGGLTERRTVRTDSVGSTTTAGCAVVLLPMVEGNSRDCEPGGG